MSNVIKRYPEGQEFLISMRNGEYLTCSGDFYMNRSTWESDHIDLRKIVNERKITHVIIRNPSEINVWGNDIEMHIEYFTSMTILDDKIVVEL